MRVAGFATRDLKLFQIGLLELTVPQNRHDASRADSTDGSGSPSDGQVVQRSGDSLSSLAELRHWDCDLKTSHRLTHS